jgi:hypothetical protein
MTSVEENSTQKGFEAITAIVWTSMIFNGQPLMEYVSSTTYVSCFHLLVIVYDHVILAMNSLLLAELELPKKLILPQWTQV